MSSRLIGLLSLVLASAALLPSLASARAVCGQRGRGLVDEFDAASSVFIARFEGPATSRHALPPDHRGEGGADIQVVVTRVLKGPLRVGDRVTVRWEGWAEPNGGPIAGGCRVPATEASEQYSFEMMVFARGDAGALHVRNDSSSRRLGQVNRAFVRRMARLAARRRARGSAPR